MKTIRQCKQENLNLYPNKNDVHSSIFKFLKKSEWIYPLNSFVFWFWFGLDFRHEYFPLCHVEYGSVKVNFKFSFFTEFQFKKLIGFTRQGDLVGQKANIITQ